MVRKQLLLTLLFCSFFFSNVNAQSEKRWLRHQIATLSGTPMHGRGYVNKGVDKAALYLRRKFREFGLLSFTADSTYFQPYTMPVNTFPGNIYLKLQKKELIPGVDYLVHEASPSFQASKLKVSSVDLKNVRDTNSWNEIRKNFRSDRAYLLKNADTLTKYLKFNRMAFGNDLPAGLFLVPKHGKLIWSVARENIPASIFYVEDTIMPKRIRRVAAQIESKHITAFKANNVLGFVPGTEKPDSFILFTAHFDHLGRMGRQTVFPGAHDNASGTALMMYLASYFAQHPQRYSIGFIGFSGEEAGLVGSKHFVNNPLFPLNSIRFVVNLDMTGDATNGITVVNAIEQKKAFALLNDINERKTYVPKINERDQSQNSDHYHFSQRGVPAIFIYSNGTKPYYHDVFDKVQELSLENIDGLSRLLIDFVAEMNKPSL